MSSEILLKFILGCIGELFEDGSVATASDLVSSGALDGAMSLLGEESTEWCEREMPEMHEQQRRVMVLVEAYDWNGGDMRTFKGSHSRSRWRECVGSG